MRNAVNNLNQTFHESLSILSQSNFSIETQNFLGPLLFFLCGIITGMVALCAEYIIFYTVVPWFRRSLKDKRRLLPFSQASNQEKSISLQCVHTSLFFSEAVPPDVHHSRLQQIRLFRKEPSEGGASSGREVIFFLKNIFFLFDFKFRKCLNFGFTFRFLFF